MQIARKSSTPKINADDLPNESEYFRSKRRKLKLQFNIQLSNVLGTQCIHCQKCDKLRQFLHQCKEFGSAKNTRSIDWKAKQEKQYKIFLDQILFRVKNEDVLTVLQQPYYFISSKHIGQKLVTRLLDQRKQIRKKLSLKPPNDSKPFALKTQERWWMRKHKTQTQVANRTFMKEKVKYNKTYKQVDQETIKQLAINRLLKRKNLIVEMEGRMKRAQEIKQKFQEQLKERLRRKAQLDKAKKYIDYQRQID